MDPGATGRTRSEPEVNRPPTRPKPGSRNTFSSPRGGESTCNKTPKTRTPKNHQTPSSKHQGNPKRQFPKGASGHRPLQITPQKRSRETKVLGFEAWSFSGVWSLEFGF